MTVGGVGGLGVSGQPRASQENMYSLESAGADAAVGKFGAEIAGIAVFAGAGAVVGLLPAPGRFVVAEWVLPSKRMKGPGTWEHTSRRRTWRREGGT